MNKNNSFFHKISLLRIPIILIAAAIIFMYALTVFDDGQSDEQRRQLEEALRLSTVACYANEGIYPPNLEYLQKHYGVQIDTKRYAVSYDIFAENIMPDITVVELK